MGETFQGIMGNFNGYALENSDFNPQSDDSNIKGFFNDDQGQVIDRRTIRKGRIKRIKKTRRRKSEVKSVVRSDAGFGGMTGGF